MRQHSYPLVLFLAAMLVAPLYSQQGKSPSDAVGEDVDAPAAEGPAPDGVDIELRLAAGTMNHRLLSYELCSPRGCTSESYLQWFKTEWSPESSDADEMPERIILATCPLPELTGEAEVVRAHWKSGSGADPELAVLVSPPARDPEDYQLFIAPAKPCDYSVRRAAAGEE